MPFAVARIVGATRSTGFRANSSRSFTTPAHDWANYPQALQQLVDRVRGVVIENRDARATMRHHDAPATLHYVDPPYMHDLRSKKADVKFRMYRHEMNDTDHAALLEFLPSLAGMVVLSGYDCALYNAALAGWDKRTTLAYADGARPRTEVLWLNPLCAERLAVAKAPLFMPA